MDNPQCHVCRSVDPAIILHNIPHRGVYSSVCTACVLRLHPGTFCPICFDVYDDTTTAHSRVMCLRCPALAHFNCLPSALARSRYLCPQCSDAGFSFFDFATADSTSNGGKAIVFTRDLAEQLLCAAKIAAVSMHKAAARARADAELKVKGALLARQKATEAIERVAYLAANQQTQDESEVDDG